MTAPLNLTIPQADAIIEQLTTRIHQLIGTDYRDAAAAVEPRTGPRNPSSSAPMTELISRYSGRMTESRTRATD